MKTELYLEQLERWPKSGRHVLAHFDDESIVVYQAYRTSIARHALEHHAFGGPEFDFTRMSWIKPNFLWMMFRSGWATKQDQETVLGLRIRRAFFDRILAAAVPSSFGVGRYETQDAWKSAVSGSNVRLQWDPDHDPSGAKVERRAIQLGLRGDMLRTYATTELLEVIDMTPLIAEQRPNALRDRWPQLRTPEERVYRPADPATCMNIATD